MKASRRTGESIMSDARPSSITPPRRVVVKNCELAKAERGCAWEIGRFLLANGPASIADMVEALHYPEVTIVTCLAVEPEWFVRVADLWCVTARFVERQRID